MSVGAFKAAVVNGAVAEISRVKGVGKKTAERIVLELKDKVGVAAAWEAASSKQAEGAAEINDALLALISLGYKQVDAHKAVKQALEGEKSRPSTEELVRRALKTLI